VLIHALFDEIYYHALDLGESESQLGTLIGKDLQADRPFQTGVERNTCYGYRPTTSLAYKVSKFMPLITQVQPLIT
jgi:hypothetical protein